MTMDRRTVIAGASALLASCAGPQTMSRRMQYMYGLIGSMTATAGNRDALAVHLLSGLRDMPGNLLYVVAHDPVHADKLWITEVWDNAESHRASLQLPQVQAAIAAARPIIAGMGDRQETVPIGGVGL
jgi:quinol monooxygenase YgiN